MINSQRTKRKDELVLISPLPVPGQYAGECVCVCVMCHVCLLLAVYWQCLFLEGSSVGASKGRQQSGLVTQRPEEPLLQVIKLSPKALKG